MRNKNDFQNLLSETWHKNFINLYLSYSTSINFYYQKYNMNQIIIFKKIYKIIHKFKKNFKDSS